MQLLLLPVELRDKVRRGLPFRCHAYEAVCREWLAHSRSFQVRRLKSLLALLPEVEARNILMYGLAAAVAHFYSGYPCRYSVSTMIHEACCVENAADCPASHSWAFAKDIFNEAHRFAKHLGRGPDLVEACRALADDVKRSANAEYTYHWDYYTTLPQTEAVYRAQLRRGPDRVTQRAVVVAKLAIMHGNCQGWDRQEATAQVQDLAEWFVCPDGRHNYPTMHREFSARLTPYQRAVVQPGEYRAALNRRVKEHNTRVDVSTGRLASSTMYAMLKRDLRNAADEMGIDSTGTKMDIILRILRHQADRAS